MSIGGGAISIGALDGIMVSSGPFAIGVLFSLDAETGDESEWTSTTADAGNTFAATEGSKHAGSYGFDLSFGGSNPECYGSKTVGDMPADFYERFYFKLSVAFSFGATWKKGWLFRLYDDATECAFVQLEETGTLGNFQLKFRLNNPYVAIATTAINRNQWYCAEIHYKKDAAVGGCQYWLDEGDQGSDFTQDTSARIIDNFILGLASANANATGSIFLDDIVGDASPVGT